MERLWTIMKKEIYHIWRDPRTLGLILLLPGLLLILLGYGVSGESNKIPMAIADLSKTDASRQYIANYTASKDFKVSYDVLSENDLFSLLDSGDVQVGLLIPEDFGRKLNTGETADVQFYINGSTDPTNVQTIQLKLSAIGQMAAQNILVKQIIRSGTTTGLICRWICSPRPSITRMEIASSTSFRGSSRSSCRSRHCFCLHWRL